MNSVFKHIKSDLPASLVVFFVAVPLCLGIALASGAPLFSGIIAGIVGGIVVGLLSGSQLGVSGPAAGLAVIVLNSIKDLGGEYQTFLLAVVIAGCIQLALGFAKAGFIAYFFPSSVIKGMLTGIGLLIILKQIPHALGWDKDAEGDDAFFQPDGENTFSEILKAWDYVTPGAIIITVISLAILLLWDTAAFKKNKIFTMFNGPLVAVIVGILLNYLFNHHFLSFTLDPEHVVSIPEPKSFSDFFSQFSMPNFSAIGTYKVWEIAFVLAIVASLETLLSVEATDKLDPQKRITPTNQELKAQGIGNIVSGMIGGLPLTQVIVRSSANINFGGKTKLSAIIHGCFLLLSSIFIAKLINMIPLATLAAVLLVVGYKLAKPALFKQMYALGAEQFVPFVVTVVVILFTNLLKGIGAGLVVGGLYVLWNSYKNSHNTHETETTQNNQKVFRFELAEQVTFFNKASLIKSLELVPANSKVIFDCSKTITMAYDVSELIEDYSHTAKRQNIEVETINFKMAS